MNGRYFQFPIYLKHRWAGSLVFEAGLTPEEYALVRQQIEFNLNLVSEFVEHEARKSEAMNDPDSPAGTARDMDEAILTH